MILFGCPGVLPECPFDQSYETAYAKIVPVRLNAEAETGPGHCSKAVAHKQTRKAKSVGDSEKASGGKEEQILTFQTRAGVFVPKVDGAIRS